MKQDRNERRLQELKNSKFEIADGEPDITGWDVYLTNDEKVGEVKDLIFDTTSQKVRYLKVRLNDKAVTSDARTVLIPIGFAQIKNLTHKVALTGVTPSQLQNLPEYDEDDLGPVQESGIRSTLSTDQTSDTTAGTSDDFYAHEHFNDDRFYSRDEDEKTLSGEGDTVKVMKENLEVGKREIQTGGIRVRSRVVETPVEETVSLREENVSVERTPVDRPANESDFHDQDLEIRTSAEIPTIKKDARVVEEISISKEIEEREQAIRETVKETKVDVDNLGKDRRGNDNLGR